MDRTALYRQQYEQQQPTVIHGKRGEEFRKKIGDVLRFGKINEKYIDDLLSESSMEEYSKAFTSSSVDYRNNYEIYEQKGDVIANCFIVWYAYKRFPQLRCPEGVQIVALLRIKYGSKSSFSKIADALGFEKFISVTVEKMSKERKSILEDCLESFCGVTVEILDNKYMVGVGYSIIYEVLSHMFDEMVDISLEYEDLKDSKTILKEIIDKDRKKQQKTFVDPQPSYRKVGFDEARKLVITEVYVKVVDGSGNPRDVLIGTGKGSTGDISAQAASKEAIKWMKSNGFYDGPPDFWRNLCMTK